MLYNFTGEKHLLRIFRFFYTEPPEVLKSFDKICIDRCKERKLVSLYNVLAYTYIVFIHIQSILLTESFQENVFIEDVIETILF